MQQGLRPLFSLVDDMTDKTEQKAPDMSLMAQLSAQREVNQKIASDAEAAKKKNTTEVEKELNQAKNMLKALENENATLKLQLGELKKTITQLESDNGSLKSASRSRENKHKQDLKKSS